MFKKLLVCIAAAAAASSFAQYESNKVALKANITPAQFGASAGNSCWGYVSPSGREYAIMGLNNRAAFVDITDPANPVYFAYIPHTSSTWADMKVYDHYAYIVSEATGVGIQVVDLADIDNHNITLVRTITSPGRSHNITLDPVSGYIYTAGSNNGTGTTMCFSLADPSNPVKVGPNSMTINYEHDILPFTYTSGPYAGKQILFCSSESRGVQIYDVTNKNLPTLIKTVTYPNVGYCHQAWLSDDLRYLYVDDEFDESNNGFTTRTIVLDVSNLANASFVTTFTSGMTTIDHNQYHRDGYLFQANYESGLRVFYTFDNPTAPTQVGWLDTYPSRNGNAYNGAWNCFPFFPSGTVILSDIQSGLFIMDPSEALTREAAPATYTITRGVALAGGLAQLKDSDGQTLDVRPGAVFASGDMPLVVEFQAFSSTLNPKGLKFAVDCMASANNISQKMELFNFSSGLWELVDTRTATTFSTVAEYVVPGNRNQYVNTLTNAVRARASWKANGAVFGYPWVIKLDRVFWTISA
jgi:choice-of-anchor B domain-containing protein